MLHYPPTLFFSNGTFMTPDEYKAARKELGLNVSDWVDKLGISISTHKKYSCGALNVQQAVANHIETLLELDKLRKKIESVYNN